MLACLEFLLENRPLENLWFRYFWYNFGYFDEVDSRRCLKIDVGFLLVYLSFYHCQNKSGLLCFGMIMLRLQNKSYHIVDILPKHFQIELTLPFRNMGNYKQWNQRLD